MKSLRSLLVGALATVLIVSAGYSGIYNFPFASSTATSRNAATIPMTGAECVAADTNLTQGLMPQTGCYTQGNLKGNYAVALTDAATITWNNSGNANLYTVSISGARTMSAPISATTGQVMMLAVTQGVTSSTITWNSVFNWPGAAATGASTAPTLSVTAGRIDLFEFVFDGTKWLGATLGQRYSHL